MVFSKNREDCGLFVLIGRSLLSTALDSTQGVSRMQQALDDSLVRHEG